MPIAKLPPDVRITPKLSPMSEVYDWSFAFLGIPEAWQQTQGEDMRICILDTGCDVNHPDLKDAILDAQDFTGSRYGYDDVHSHGTWCAGAIGARAGNNIGVAGIAPKCKLLIAKVLGDNGAGDEQSIASGMRWGFNKGATIFSLSLGGGAPMPSVDAIAKELDAAGRHFPFAASGNDGADVNFPAASQWFISVGACDKQGNLTEFTSKRGRLDIVGPGQDMLSTIPGGRYGTMTGTSMACPIVAAVGALASAKHIKDGGDSDLVSVADMREHLVKSATDRGSYRLLNPRKLLERHGVAKPVEPERDLVLSLPSRFELWRRRPA